MWPLQIWARHGPGVIRNCHQNRPPPAHRGTRLPRCQLAKDAPAADAAGACAPGGARDRADQQRAWLVPEQGRVTWVATATTEPHWGPRSLHLAGIEPVVFRLSAVVRSRCRKLGELALQHRASAQHPKPKPKPDAVGVSSSDPPSSGMTANKTRPILLPTKCSCSAHPHPHPRFAGDRGSIPKPIPDLPGIGDHPHPLFPSGGPCPAQKGRKANLYGNFKLNQSSRVC